MAKQTITQRDFSFGVTIPELLEGDDLEVRQKSVQDASNVRVTSGRTLRNRMGSWYRSDLTAANDELFEMVVDGTHYGVIVSDAALTVIDDRYEILALFESVPWASADDVWLAPFGKTAILGPELYALTIEDGVWSFGAFALAESAGGALTIPYWSYEPGVTIQPSAYSGSVVVTASDPIFSPEWEGDRLRYAESEMVVTQCLSPTTIRADVTTELPPTFRITVSSTSGFEVGQVVVASETTWSGIIVEISGSDLIVVTLRREVTTGTSSTSIGTPIGGFVRLVSVGTTDYGGPLTTEEVVGPNRAEQPLAVTLVAAPRETKVWDEQLWSARRGWPRSGAAVNNRLALCDFPQIGDLVAMSSARSFQDFQVGLDDDDAIVRQAGNNAPRFRHIVGGLDLILLADRGCYFVKTRDGELVTPSNFQVVQFDQRGASSVRPALVDSGVVFVEESNGQLAACVLDGNVYLNWSVISLSRLSQDLFSDTVGLCGPVQSSALNEKYLLAVQGDGSLVAMSWETQFGEERAGFLPWSRAAGAWRSVTPMFGGYHAVVEHGGGAVTLEEFDPTAQTDSARTGLTAINSLPLITTGGVSLTTTGGVTITARPTAMPHLASETVAIYANNETLSTVALDSNGDAAVEPALDAGDQVGLPITGYVIPWPVEHVQSPRAGMLKVRIIRMGVSVRETNTFSVNRNNYRTTIPLRGAADDPGDPVPLKTDLYRFTVWGNRAHPEMVIEHQQSGPFEIAAITQEVQV